MNGTLPAVTCLPRAAREVKKIMVSLVSWLTSVYGTASVFMKNLFWGKSRYVANARPVLAHSGFLKFTPR